MPDELAALLRDFAEAEDPLERAALERRLRDWPDHREHIEDWMKTARLTDDELGRDRELLDEIEARPVDTQDLEFVRELILPARPSFWARATPWLAAAALLGALGLGWRLLGSDRPVDPGPSSTTLLGDALAVQAPRGEVQAVTEFRWEALELPPFGHYVLSAEDSEGDLFPPVEIDTNRYTPNPAQLEALREARSFVWRIEAFDGAGHRIAWSDFIEVSLPGL